MSAQSKAQIATAARVRVLHHRPVDGLRRAGVEARLVELDKPRRLRARGRAARAASAMSGRGRPQFVQHQAEGENRKTPAFQLCSPSATKPLAVSQVGLLDEPLDRDGALRRGGAPRRI